MRSEKVECRTPTPGKKSTNIDKWKFDIVRKAILNVVQKQGDGILFSDLPKRLNLELSKSTIDKLGSLSWYTTTVKLELEVRGELKRLKGVSPQRLLKC